jgi:sulfur carrier protein ThiS
MKVLIERENKTVDIQAATGTELLAKLEINPTTILLVQNNNVVIPEVELQDTDEIKILSVISGG